MGSPPPPPPPPPPSAATPCLTVSTRRPLLPLAAECIAVRPAILQVAVDHFI
jgi:hypothetical protein